MSLLNLKKLKEEQAKREALEKKVDDLSSTLQEVLKILPKHATTHLPGGSDSLPWGHKKGLDADTVDKKHAEDIVQEVVEKAKPVVVPGGVLKHPAEYHERGSARILSGLLADRPSPKVVDRLYHATDTNVLYRDTGTSWVEISGVAGADEKVKVSSVDTTANFLQPKMAAGTGISLTKLNPGANESLEVSAHERQHALFGSDHTGEITDIQHGSRGSSLHSDVVGGTTGVLTDAQHGSRGSGLHADSHGRLHALDSSPDHSGTITDDQHGTKTTIPDAHHSRLHQASHLAGADALPWGSLGGLDADKVDGLHAAELGGGPHASTHEVDGTDVVKPYLHISGTWRIYGESSPFDLQAEDQDMYSEGELYFDEDTGKMKVM